MKPCHLCKNVFSRGHEKASLHDSWAVDICCAEPEKFSLSTDAEIFTWADQQRARKSVLSATAFSREETLSGFTFHEKSLLQDQLLRTELPPSRMLFDVMHTYWTSGGVAASEIALLMTRVKENMQIEPSDLAAMAKQSRWCRPAGVASKSPAWRAALFHPSRFGEGTYKGSATDCRALLPLLACFLEELGAARPQAQLQRELHSLGLLLQIRLQLAKLKAGHGSAGLSDLQRLQVAHQSAVANCYKDAMRPKHHWRLHMPAQMTDVAGMWIDTEPAEKKHQSYKAVSNKNTDSCVGRQPFAKAVLSRMLFSCLDSLQSRHDALQMQIFGNPEPVLLLGHHLRKIKGFRLEGIRWSTNDFLVSPLCGFVEHCCLDKNDRPLLLVRKCTLQRKMLFSSLFTPGDEILAVTDFTQLRAATFWLSEADGLRVLL